MTVVELYGRDGCHLCDEARVVIQRVAMRVQFDFVERDIEADESLLRRYLERIPVVTVDGLEVFEYFVDESALEGIVGR